MRIRRDSLIIAALLTLSSGFTHPGHAYASPLVIGGKDLNTGEYSAVTDIETFIGSNMGNICTATFISNNTLLTAAHCVFQYLNAHDAELILPAGAQVKAVFIPNAFTEFKNQELRRIPGAEFEKINADVALIVLQKPITTNTISISTYARTGTAMMIGFGGKQLLPVTKLNRAMDETAGVKRKGFTEVAMIHSSGRIDSRMEIYQARKWFHFSDYFRSQEPHQALASRGDSGGPLIQYGKVIAVTSGTDASHQDENQVYSSRTYFAGLHSDYFKEIKEKATQAGSTLAE